MRGAGEEERHALPAAQAAGFILGTLWHVFAVGMKCPHKMRPSRGFSFHSGAQENNEFQEAEVGGSISVMCSVPRGLKAPGSPYLGQSDIGQFLGSACLPKEKRASLGST